MWQWQVCGRWVLNFSISFMYFGNYFCGFLLNQMWFKIQNATIRFDFNNLHLFLFLLFTQIPIILVFLSFEHKSNLMNWFAPKCCERHHTKWTRNQNMPIVEFPLKADEKEWTFVRFFDFFCVCSPSLNICSPQYNHLVYSLEVSEWFSSQHFLLAQYRK